MAYQGNVEAMLQRRNDIANNLSKAVLDYSTHERGVFTAVVSLRSFISEDQLAKDEYLKKLNTTLNQRNPSLPFEKGAFEAAKDESLMSSLSKLMALAEQYPDLKLSTNFQSLMAALIEVEKDLATERIKLNDMVNTYTTNVAMFPCNIFAFLYRFPRSSYFDATEEAKAFKLINY
jgi:LemA protein